MNIDFPKEHSHLLDKYNISKEFNKNRSFLLELDNIPDLIYGINNKEEWILAQGKNGLYKLINSLNESHPKLENLPFGFYRLKDSNDQFSLNEIYHKLDNVPYDFIIGNLKDEGKYLAPHPISGKITEWSSSDAYEMCEKLNKRIIPELEPAIAKDAYYSYLYANYIIKGRFELGEPAIAMNPEHSCYYAINVLHGRFLLGEKAISQNSIHSYDYAKDIIKGRWEPGEAAIAKSAAYSYLYATEIIKRRFPLGEPVLLKFEKLEEWAQKYTKFLGNDDWKKDFKK
jgi:hypothetical protein